MYGAPAVRHLFTFFDFILFLLFVNKLKKSNCRRLITEKSETSLGQPVYAFLLCLLTKLTQIPFLLLIHFMILILQVNMKSIFFYNLFSRSAHIKAKS